MTPLFRPVLRRLEAVMAFFENVGAATRIASDIRRGRSPRLPDMETLGISEAYRAYRAV